MNKEVDDIFLHTDIKLSDSFTEKKCLAIKAAISFPLL